MKIVQIAEVAHEANRAYCNSLGDDSQKEWEEAPDWQRQSAIKGVEFIRDNPEDVIILCIGWVFAPLTVLFIMICYPSALILRQILRCAENHRD